ncbi:MAG: HDIG domain-containing protein [Elusimicrobiota bacterium]|nr:HDIG domain-containing protein [Elusimicrobiota bacterium]
MGRLKSFFSQTFRRWSEKLDKSSGRKNVLKKDIPFPMWPVGLMISLSLLTALAAEFGFEKSIVAGSGIFTILWIYAAVSFVKKEKEMRPSEILLSVLIVVAAVLMTQIAKSKEISMYFVFTPAAASLLNFLVSRRAAEKAALLISLIVSFIYLGNFEVFFISFVGAMGAIAFPRRIIKRSDIFLNGLSIFIFLLAANIALKLMGIYGGSFVYDGIRAPFLVAAVTSVFIMSFFPLFEWVFNLTSDVRLIELGDFNHPLLKKLMIAAPGTYHHSLMVAALSEAAASAIKCNSLLARVGAYYHDVGKIGKAQYFIENQIEGNIHEKLKPEMSALVILSHVKEGVKLAAEAGVDECILDFIAQHHGTTIVQYFFRKAAVSGGARDETVYKYPGPLPQTRETAIVMLADSVEAACRAIEEPSYEKIKDTVHKIINSYFAGGQLNECPITLKNIQKIGDVFTKTLISIHHIRLDYSDADKPVAEKQQ